MRTLVVMYFMALFTPTLCAQSNDSTSNTSYLYKSSVVLDRMVRELSLTKKQASSVKAILDQQFEALSSKAADRKSQVELENAKANAKLEKILTPAQLEKLIEIRNDKKLAKQRFVKDNPQLKESDEDVELDF
jgi:Spy/CpxP family protein refolding chaperone